MQKYSVNQYLINNILSWVQAGEIAIPEIQRPFVWSSTKVRDLMDSLYKGYPVGYIITWKNPDVRLKDGTISSGKKILIDGQQRITALRAAVLGEKVLDSDYVEKRIYISFNPLTEEFQTLNPAIKKSKDWIQDIAEIMKTEGTLITAVQQYCERNPDAERSQVERAITTLLEIKNKQVGFIDLEANLDIETVTEIFIRINSKGVVLSQADFAMSKIASYEGEGHFGVNLRKGIDYFAHMLRDARFYSTIEQNDKEFMASDYPAKITWAKDENGTLYVPDYNDILRVAFTKKFSRGKMSDLVALLSGRNFETRGYEEEIQRQSFLDLKEGVLDTVNQNHFNRFVMILKSAGFTEDWMIRSKMAANFAYAMYLSLREQGMDDGEIEKLVRKWFVMSHLTSRYSASAESAIDSDIKELKRRGPHEFLRIAEETSLSDTFWNIGLPEELDKATLSNPFIATFFAAQVRSGDKGFLSKEITVASMLAHRGDVHHLFPKEYLKKQYHNRADYNQIANFVYAQTEINIRLGKKSPKEYMHQVLEQCSGGKVVYGGITNEAELWDNFEQHCIPREFVDMEIDSYKDFLEERKKLMAKKIENYYKSL